MKLISDEYRALNAHEHNCQNGYGIQGYKHLPQVLKLAERMQAQSVLDYGCGQATLSKHARRVSPLEFRNYDPAIAEFSALPEPADIVVCTDVLEHVEPACLAEVLGHIASLANKAAYLEIACRPAKRVLSDGRNAHINVRDGEFWLYTIRNYMDVLEYRAVPRHSVLIIGVTGGTLWT